jgi:hypothetical protein
VQPVKIQHIAPASRHIKLDHGFDRTYATYPLIDSSQDFHESTHLLKKWLDSGLTSIYPLRNIRGENLESRKSGKISNVGANIWFNHHSLVAHRQELWEGSDAVRDPSHLASLFSSFSFLDG